MFLITSLTSKAQNIEKIDSVIVYRIPWKLNTKFNVSDKVLLNKKTIPHNIITVRKITDMIALNYLSQIKISKKSLVHDEDLDLRCILIIYSNNEISNTIALDKIGRYYTKNDKIPKRNIRLLIWLQEYVPLINNQAEFINPEKVPSFKKKCSFMLETMK